MNGVPGLSGPHWRRVMAALANRDARTAYAQMVLGEEVFPGVKQQRRTRAIAVLLEAGLAEWTGSRGLEASDAVFRELLSQQPKRQVPASDVLGADDGRQNCQGDYEQARQRGRRQDGVEHAANDVCDGGRALAVVFGISARATAAGARFGFIPQRVPGQRLRLPSPSSEGGAARCSRAAALPGGAAQAAALRATHTPAPLPRVAGTCTGPRPLGVMGHLVKVPQHVAHVRGAGGVPG